MKYALQFGIIIAISFVGEILHTVIPLPVPASIYGIFILFGLLASGVLKTDSIRETARFFIEVMPILFIAPVVSIIDEWDVMRSIFGQFFFISLVTTVIVMVASGWITQFVIRRGRKKEQAPASGQSAEGGSVHA